MNGLARDILLGFRRLARTPGQTLAAVAALTLGIGLSTAAFSMTWGIVVRGLPVEKAEQILHLESDNPSQNQPSLGVYLQDFLELAPAPDLVRGARRLSIANRQPERRPSGGAGRGGAPQR